MRAFVLVPAAIAAGLLLLPATGAAKDGASAWPYKSEDDSGRYLAAQCTGTNCIFRQKFGKYHSVDGYDPCVFDYQVVIPPPVQPSTVDQYVVPNCRPVISPWIKTKPWQTRNWDLYCPMDAPYSWSLAFEREQVIRESKFQTISNWGPSERRGPKPVGRVNLYSTNFAFKTHNWAWSASCSDKEPDPDWRKPKYQRYTGGTVPTASKISPNRSGVVATRGPAWRSARVDDQNISRTIEIDLVPNATRKYAATCPKGHTVGDARHGVGWYTVAPPTRSQSARVDDEMSSIKNGRGVQVLVKTKAIPRKTVRLQMSLNCTTEAT